MKRREFIAGLGSAAAWPVAAWAQAQQRTVPVVGYLHAASQNSNEAVTLAFRKGLRETGYVEGRNLAVEYKFANNDPNRLVNLAADLTRRRVAAIVAAGGAVSARAAKAATASIPIVFVMGDDPVAAGVVASFNRPSENVTGIAFLSAQLGPKRLGLLNELVPTAMRYAVLVNPDNPATESIIAELRPAAAAIGVQVTVFSASSIREIDAAFADLVRSGAEALVVVNSALFGTRSGQLATLAAYHHLPAIYYNRAAAEVGGLMSYGANIADATRQAGIYVGRILKGEKPADLPVMQSVNIEFVINLQTARTLGIEVPTTLLVRADEVIE